MVLFASLEIMKEKGKEIMKEKEVKNWGTWGQTDWECLCLGEAAGEGFQEVSFEDQPAMRSALECAGSYCLCISISQTCLHIRLI